MAAYRAEETGGDGVEVGVIEINLSLGNRRRWHDQEKTIWMAVKVTNCLAKLVLCLPSCSAILRYPHPHAYLI